MFSPLVPRRERSLFPNTDRMTRMLGRVEGEMQDLVDRFWGGEVGWPTANASFAPTIDFVETEGGFEVTVDLPGLKPEEVNVELKDGDLWISGKRDEQKEEEGKTFHRVERHHGEFRRVLPLPAAIDEEKIDAKFEDGVLCITVPKTQEAKPKRIDVKS